MSTRLTQACAIFGALFVDPSAGMADEAVGCAQAGLRSHGYYAGPVDGMVSFEMIEAAEMFAEATTFPMPSLTPASAPEWCHMLRAWDDLTVADREPRELNNNTNPGALPLGIWFDTPVPMTVRQLILDDLIWLAALGELEASAEVASFLGLGPSATGSELVAWLLLHVRGVSVTLPCLRSPTVLVNDALDGSADSIHAGIDVFRRCDGALRGYWGFVEENAYSPRLAARYYDDHVLFTRGEAFPVIHLGDLFIQSRSSRAFINRVSRLTTLFHEAHHIAGAPDHVTCSHLNLLSRTDAFGRPGTMLNGIGRNCDVGIRSAYYLDGLMAELLLANCAECGPAEADDIRRLAIRAFMRVQIRLSSAQLVDGSDLFDRVNASEVRIQYIPPDRFFELQADEFADASEEMPPWFVELRAIAAQLADDVDHLDEPGVVTPAAMNPDLAMAWLHRAHRSGDQDYNVPLVAAPPCEQTQIGCREDWWDRIEIIENGVATTVALGPGAEVRLARFEIADEGAATLRVSLVGDGRGASLNICHLESERCVERFGDTDRAVIRWPDTASGTYVVWIDGFGTDAAAPGAQPLTLMARW